MEVKERIKIVRNKIIDTALRSGRDAKEIKLLAVTKTHSIEVIRESLAAGLKCIGENKVQEARQKIPQLSDEYDEFHFIGHLQTNKVKKLLSLRPALIHSVDSLHLAQKIDKEASSAGIIQSVLMQVNTSGEESKSGISPDAAEALAAGISDLTNVRLQGLMTIGRFTEKESEIRESFRKLINLKKLLQEQGKDMRWVSMGMSHDFEIAIEEGANLLRLGTALFGKREKVGTCQIR